MSRLILTMVLLVCGSLCVPSLAFAEEHPVVAEATHPPANSHAHGAELPMSWQTDLALFSVITFGVFLWVLKVGAWGPLQSGLNERERLIRQNIADAETGRLKSEALLKSYEAKLSKVQEEVRDILAEARRDADSTKQDIVATAQREAESTKQRAIAEIERSRDLALNELFDFVSNNVVNATEHVIGRSLTGEDQNRLVNDALAQLNVRRN